jgi:hypothetical protein
MFRCEQHHPEGEHYLRLAKVTIVKMSQHSLTWFIQRYGRIYYYLVCNEKHCVKYRSNIVLKTKKMLSKLVVLTLVNVCVWHWSELD